MYVPVAELVGVHEFYLRPVGHLGVVVLLEDVSTGLATVTLSPTLRLSHMAWIQSMIFDFVWRHYFRYLGVSRLFLARKRYP